MPIHPMFPHSFRCFVKLSIMYLELVFIIKGQKFGTMVVAFITAATSPTWFDQSGPGTFRAVLS